MNHASKEKKEEKRLMLLLGIWFILSAFTPIPISAASGAIFILNGEITAEPVAGPEDDLKKIEPAPAGFSRFTDYANGYSIYVPGDSYTDVSLSPVVNVFISSTSRMEIYYDNFYGTQADAYQYMEYGNRFARNTRDHTVLSDQMLNINGFDVHLLKWDRRKLAKIADDKNHYASIEMAKNGNEVYTILIKSSQPIANELNIARSFTLIERRGTPKFSKHFAHSTTLLNDETRKLYDEYFGMDSPLRWGIFEVSAPQTFETLDPLETSVNYQFPILVRYQSLDEHLPLHTLEQAYQRQRYLELTLQTFYQFQDTSGVIYDILDGKYDEYFTEYAVRLKTFGHPVLFRLNNEMNGDWCLYSPFHYSKDPELYKALWRYVQNVFAANGVDNVLWVWNPHDLSLPDFKWNHYLMYYPGDEYVDIIGLTGYNTGTYFPGEKWREFAAIYSELYNDYDRHFGKPFMITEFGSNSVGGDKVAWLSSMFSEIGQLSKIKIAIWWNGIDYDSKGVPGRIYLLNETPETTAAFRQGLAKFPAQLLPKAIGPR
ncbi:MAG TPA: glycosyl hydrolase [Methylomusa anaerophila]|nr:glycosyl hydrolase [Methylomusa anaerophila]HML89064.1 glycosyl hydrolase [Methylomusa anaerophila]